MSPLGSDPYTSLLAKYGPTAQGCGWKDAETQHRRFEVLLDLYKLRRLGRALLDVGCGVGDLAPLTFKRELFYAGIDHNRDMVSAAQRKHLGYPFFHASLDEMELKFDVVVASGLFTYASLVDLDHAIEKMLALAKEAVTFNALSGWGSGQEPGETLFNPKDVLSMCRLHTQNVVLRHDYHPGDFTIYMFK